MDEVTELVEKQTLPVPVNRYLLVKNNVTPEDVKPAAGIIVKEDSLQDKINKKLNKLFPDGTMRYQVLAKAIDCTLPVNKGQWVILSFSGKSRQHEMIMDGKYMLISEGDVAAICDYEIRTDISEG